MVAWARFTLLLTTCLILVGQPFKAEANSEIQATVNFFHSTPASEAYFESAYGYAVFPTIGKGGFWVGGAFGTGAVFQGGHQTGTSELAELSLGFQFGGQTYSQIIFFQDQRAYERFISGSFEFDAQSSAVAITESASARAGTQGRSAQAGESQSHAGWVNGMAVFTHGQGGLMIEAALAGQKYNFVPLAQ
uniref:lipid-binding SYLF domain-containing protein n=1 Tax=Thaumasiovibrio occultus TaxID=1891184 RepID=UPI000B363E95|nr:lipid-binding SYLF domain-containing protein [Thaumasiovibrio occultus]